MPGRTAAEIRMTRDRKTREKQDRTRPDPLVASLSPRFLDLARRMNVPTDVAIRQVLDRSDRIGLEQ